LLDQKNNYVQRLSVDDNAEKSFNILAISLSTLHNYFDGPNKIIFRSVSSKFSDTLAKLFFPCNIKINDHYLSYTESC